MSNLIASLDIDFHNICRLCLREPETDRTVRFFHIFSPYDDDGITPRQLISDVLNLDIDEKDSKPNVVCAPCHSNLLDFKEQKIKSAESKIVIEYIANKRFKHPQHKTNQHNEPDISSDSRNNDESTNASLHFQRKPKIISITTSTPKSTLSLQANPYGIGYSNQASSSRSFSTNENMSTQYDNSNSYISEQKVNVTNDMIYIESDDEESDNSSLNKKVLENKWTKNKNLLSGSSLTKRYNKESINRKPTSQYLLFTCLKPSCNKIFQKFYVFKIHYREHFKIRSKIMCWQCCKPFSSLKDFRAHKVKGNCCTLGIFKCFNCPQKFNDLQNLSVHKYTMHNGNLITGKNANNTIKCPNCKINTNIQTFKDHLVNCLSINKTVTTPEPKLIKITSSNSEDLDCGKICTMAAATSTHIKVCTYPSATKMMKNKIGNTSMPSNTSYALTAASTAQKMESEEQNEQIIYEENSNDNEKSEIKTEYGMSGQKNNVHGINTTA